MIRHTIFNYQSLSTLRESVCLSVVPTTFNEILGSKGAVDAMSINSSLSNALPH